eukprot:1194573-Prorocentrum_minimum.AAC.8
MDLHSLLHEDEEDELSGSDMEADFTTVATRREFTYAGASGNPASDENDRLFGNCSASSVKRNAACGKNNQEDISTLEEGELEEEEVQPSSVVEKGNNDVLPSRVTAKVNRSDLIID